MNQALRSLPQAQRAAIYCRVSSVDQEDNYSLPTQEAACREYCDRHGYQVVGVFTDVHTGAQYRERPGLSQLRELVRQRAVDVVVSYAVDRLSRNQAHVYILYEEFSDYGCRLEFVTEKFEDTPVGKFVLAAKSFAAEVEREKIKERSLRGRRARAESGKLLAARVPLYGYQWADETKSRYILNPVTAPVVKRIFEMALRGAGTTCIANTLTNEGIPSPSGLRHWNSTTVHKILTNPMYTGEARAFTWQSRKGYKRYWDRGIPLPEGTVPAIVDRATFEAVQRQLHLNWLRSSRRNRSPESWLLRGGFAVCGVCGHRLYAASNNGHAAYICEFRRHSGGPRPAIYAEELDRLAWQAVKVVLQRDDVIQHGLELIMSEQPAERELASLERAMNQLRRQQANLVQALSMVSEPSALAALTTELERIAGRLRDLEKERDELRKQAENWQQLRNQFRELTRWRKEVADRLEEMSYQERRWLLDLLGVTVRVYPEDDPEHDRVEITLGLPLGDIASPSIIDYSRHSQWLPYRPS